MQRESEDEKMEARRGRGRPDLEPRHDDEEKNDPNNPPLPVSLFHSSLRPVWKEVTKKWLITVLTLFTFILYILSLYWAVLPMSKRTYRP